jgi:HAD superfamily hydrolase (TIGR01484 family)
MEKITNNSTYIFTDFDGTLYDPSYKILLSPWYNYQTSQLIKVYGIKFFVITGRSMWTPFDDLQLRLLALPQPEVVVYGAGTHILRRNTKGILTEDLHWHSHIEATRIEWNTTSRKPAVWKKELVEDAVKPILTKNTLSLGITTNPYMVILPLFNYSQKKISILLDSLHSLWKSGVRTILTEKLYLPNSRELFNGNLLIIPDTAGKDNACRYLLKELVGEKPDALFFGDALIDVAMLTMDAAKYTHATFSYGVHMTPLAQMAIKSDDPDSKIVQHPGSAPKALRDIIKAYVKGRPIPAQEHVKIVEPA